MDWVGQFLEFFRSVESSLAVVLNADGCREGWLQGEMFRRLRTPENGLLVNQSLSIRRVKHDLIAHHPTAMVGEVKIYGMCGYLNKNLCGRSNLRRFQPVEPTGRVLLSPSDIQAIAPASSSFLGDVLRLQGLTQPAERYVILVLQKARVADEFGRAISAVRVSAVEHEWECDAFRVRLSVV